VSAYIIEGMDGGRVMLTRGDPASAIDRLQFLSRRLRDALEQEEKRRKVQARREREKHKAAKTRDELEKELQRITKAIAALG
jgi:hypothetical protein